MKKKIGIALIILLVLGVFIVLITVNPDAERLDWDTFVLCNQIPEAPNNLIEVETNDSDELWIKICNIQYEQYIDYLEECKNFGYSFEIKTEISKSFEGFNSNGYNLKLNYIDYDEELEIKLKAPFEMNEYIWPELAVSLNIKKPETEKGCFQYENEQEFLFYTKLDSFEYFKKYRNTCIPASFDNNVHETDIMFEASDDSGNFIGVYYEGGSVISIRVVKSTTETINDSTTEITPISTTTETSIIEISTTESTTTKPTTTKPTTIVESPVFYSTNTRKTVGNGNMGVYAYKDDGKFYDVYYIVDFDEGYVYYFLEGDGNEFCDKIKIESGDLNSVLIITYHEDSNEWSYGLHFKYKNQPSKLIVQDEDGFELEYSPTDLDTVLNIRVQKLYIIIDLIEYGASKI